MFVSKRLIHAAVAGAAVLAFSACGNGDSASTAATVNGHEIEFSAVESQAEVIGMDPSFHQQMEGADEDEIESQLHAFALSQLIFEVILRDGAAEIGVEVSEEDVDQGRADIATQFGGEDAMYEQLEEQGLDRAEVDRQLELFALEMAVQAELGAGDVSEADVEAAYDDGTAARHVLVEDEAEATDVYQRIDGGEDFAAVAQETSIDGSAEAGGDLGFIQLGMTVPEFEDALFAAEEGELVGPVQSDFGFHVIERLAKPALEEVEDEIRFLLEQLAMQEGEQAYGEFIGDQTLAAAVEVDPQLGEWDPDTGQVVPGDPA